MPRDSHGSLGPSEIGSWAGQRLAVMDNACLSSQCGHGILSVLFVAGFLCDLLFQKWKLFLGCSKFSEASALCLH